jgi:tripartite-type tricarboxylate transporter receptor subunit TctC
MPIAAVAAFLGRTEDEVRTQADPNPRGGNMSFEPVLCASIIISLAAGLVGKAAAAETYASRPVTMIVPFAAGGPTDTLARVVSERMRMSIGQPIIIENATGAAGTLGVGRAARAAPDGYTIGIGAWNTHVVNGAVYQLPYDVLKDFEPVGLLANNSHMIVSRNGIPASDLKQLVAWVKTNQDKASAGTAGVGASSHVSAVFFQNMTGTRFQLVPYRGVGPAIQDLMAGQIDLMFDQVSNTLQHVQAGKIRAYAVASKNRLALAADIPTVDEAGLEGFYISVWHALWVPKGTPKHIVAALNSALVETLADAAVRRRLAELGQDIPPVEKQTPDALAAFHKAEVEKWWPIIKAANIKAE